MSTQSIQINSIEIALVLYWLFAGKRRMNEVRRLARPSLADSSIQLPHFNNHICYLLLCRSLSFHIAASWPCRSRMYRELVSDCTLCKNSKGRTCLSQDITSDILQFLWINMLALLRAAAWQQVCQWMPWSCSSHVYSCVITTWPVILITAHVHQSIWLRARHHLLSSKYVYSMVAGYTCSKLRRWMEGWIDTNEPGWEWFFVLLLTVIARLCMYTCRSIEVYSKDFSLWIWIWIYLGTSLSE